MFVTTAIHLLVVISCRKYLGMQEQSKRREYCIQRKEFGYSKPELEEQ